MYPVEPSVLSGWELEETFDKEFKQEHGDVLAKRNGRAISGRPEQIRRFHEALWCTEGESQTDYRPKVAITDEEKNRFERFRRIFSKTYSAVLPGELVAECVQRIDTGVLDPAGMLGIQHFLVDEFQDLNYADNRFVEAIASDGTRPKTYVLGDDDQSIYAFRFAYPPGIQQFQCDASYTLSECFRCTPEILQVATNFIQRNSTNSRIPKDILPHHKNVPSVVRRHQFRSEKREADFIARSCKQLVENGIDPENILILISSRNTQLKPIVDAFDAVEGIKIDTPPDDKKLYFDYKWTKYIIAVLRVANDFNFVDYIAHRLVLGFLSGVGVSTCSNIKNKVVDNNLNYLDIFYHDLPSNVFSGSEKRAIAKAKLVFEKVTQWTDQDTLSDRVEEISQLIQENYSSTDYVKEWDDFVSELPEDMLISELIPFLSAQHRSQASTLLTKVYERLELEPPENELMSSRVQIMTMHGAKGLNTQIVFVPGLENEIIPGQRRKSRQGMVFEAARLLYVAITRASVGCVLTFARSRWVNKERVYGRAASDFAQDLGGTFKKELEILTEEDIQQIVKSVGEIDNSQDK